MATQLTYDSLVADVQTYLQRGGSAVTDPTVYNQIPQLINLAERRIAVELKLQGTIAVLTSTFANGTSVYAKPDRWRETVSLNFGTGSGNNERTPIYPRSYEYCRSYWPDESTTGTPKFYADYDYQHWLIVPTPDSAYPFESLIYQMPQLLDSGNQSNWLTQYAPSLLLYASLLEATPFLKNDERIQVWQAMYDRWATALAGQDLQKIMDRTSERTRA